MPERFWARERFLPSHLNLVGAAALRARATLAAARIRAVLKVAPAIIPVIAAMLRAIRLAASNTGGLSSCISLE